MYKIDWKEFNVKTLAQYPISLCSTEYILFPLYFVILLCSLFELLIKKHDKIVAQLRPIAAAQREGSLTQDQELEQQDLVGLEM